VAMDVNTTETTYSTLKSDPRIPQPVDTRVRQVVVEISQIENAFCGMDASESEILAEARVVAVQVPFFEQV
jgi:hypothetical protein